MLAQLLNYPIADILFTLYLLVYFPVEGIIVLHAVAPTTMFFAVRKLNQAKPVAVISA